MQNNLHIAKNSKINLKQQEEFDLIKMLNVVCQKAKLYEQKGNKKASCTKGCHG